MKALQSLLLGLSFLFIWAGTTTQPAQAQFQTWYWNQYEVTGDITCRCRCGIQMTFYCKQEWCQIEPIFQRVCTKFRNDCDTGGFGPCYDFQTWCSVLCS
jgi:hypothetical protein